MHWKEESSHEDEQYTPSGSCPHLIMQSGLNYLIRDFNLSKTKAAVLPSRFQEWNLLERKVKTYVYHNHENDLLPFFSSIGNMTNCKYFYGLIKSLDTIISMKNGECSLVQQREA